MIELTLSALKRPVTLRVLHVRGFLKGRNSICLVVHCVLIRPLPLCVLSYCYNFIITQTMAFSMPVCEICGMAISRGFVYLVCVMDWYSRKVLSWRISNTLDKEFCVEALEEALYVYDEAEIFNTDQGGQFTSDGFTGMLLGRGIDISMDGKGSWRGNVFVERLWRRVLSTRRCIWWRMNQLPRRRRA